MATAHELQERLSPKVLARDAWEGAKDKGADLAEDAVDAVRARPLAAGGVVAALTMFLAREPLIDLAGKLVEVNDKRKSRKSRKAKTKTETHGESLMPEQDTSRTTADAELQLAAAARDRSL